MDPHSEEALIAEARYLHSLWERGPPPRSSSHHPPPPPLHPIPTPPTTNLLHRPLNPSTFKKKKKKKKQKHVPVSDKEWPCYPPTDSSADWSRPWPKKQNSGPILVSDQEMSRLFAIQAQSKALKVTTAYFIEFKDDDESESERDGLDGFFINLFEEDEGLMEFYRKSYQAGEIVCLVCGGVGKKFAGKKYKGCLPLVQHSISVGSGRKRKEHRAFAKAVCKALGWNIDDLSSVASEMASLGGQGAAQEVVNEGGNLTEATVLGPGEMCDEKDKVEENVGKETNTSSCISVNLPVQECSSGVISEANGGSTLLKNSGTGATELKSGDDVVVADGEIETMKDIVEPSDVGCVASTDEGENAG